MQLDAVTLTRDRRDLLSEINWTVRAGEHWVVVGANGSGKTSLVRITSLYEHPSRGAVRILGERLGATDVRSLRRRIGLVSHAMADLVRPALTAVEVVAAAKYAALEPWWHTYGDADFERARSLLTEQGVGELAHRAFGSLSSGERQRVLLARTAMTEPGLVLLDEPSAGLDPGAREELVDALDRRAAATPKVPIVLVTHHVEEIPPSFTHLLALRGGRAIGCGPISEVLDDELLTACFDVPLRLRRHDGRWYSQRA
ncbi:MAG: ABC transporter ATP-binding protein [Actinomycetes bacterium]